MQGILKGDSKSYLTAIIAATAVLLLFAGIGYALNPSVLLQIEDGDGFLSDVDPDADESAPLRVVDLQLGKTSIPSQSEVEIRAIVANYGSETKNDVRIEPILTTPDGSLDVSDQMDLRPERNYTIESFEPGQTKTFTFYATFNHSPVDQGVNELTYTLKLAGADGTKNLSDIQQAERTIEIIPAGDSSSGSRFINREPTSTSAFPVNSYKDEFVTQSDVVGADISIPPVRKDSTGSISEVDVAEGEVTSFGALTQLDTRNSGSISTDDGNISVGFGFNSIPTRSHYLIRMAHGDSQISENIEMKVVDSRGDEIDINSTYEIAESDGDVERFDYHLTSEEVEYIRTQDEAYIVAETTNDGTRDTFNVSNINYLSIVGVNRIVNLPESDLEVTDLRVTDSNHQDINQRPTYELDEDMEFEAQIRNRGDSSYEGTLGLTELLQGFTSPRDTEQNIVINPNETRTFTFTTTATRAGVQEYVINDADLCSDNIDCPLQVQVEQQSEDIVPRINAVSPEVIAEETSRFRLDGIESSDYSKVNSIDWSFAGDQRTFGNAVDGTEVDYEFTEPGRKTVSVEVQYTQDGSPRVANHRIDVEVIERPMPEIDAVYYDVKTTPRSGTRTGDRYGPGLGGSIVSGSCSDECVGSISIGGTSPASTDGLNMMVLDKQFDQGQMDIVHYGTYDFDQNQVATNNGNEFSQGLQNELTAGATSQFQSDVSTYSSEGNIFIFAGGGDPSVPNSVETILEQMGADFGGTGSLGDNVPYSFIVEAQNNEYKPLHESYLPSGAGEPIEHSVEITPVEASESDVPQGREVYLAVSDQNGSDYYERLDDSQISYSWTGVDSRGEYAYIVPDSDTSVSVDLSLDTISDADQQSSATINVEDKAANIEARSTQNIISGDSTTAVTAAYSYDSDEKIDSNSYEWSITSPDGVQVTPSQTSGKQSLKVESGELAGVIEATLIYNGVEQDTTEVRVETDAEARFSTSRVPGYVNYNRAEVSPEETVIYDHGQIGAEVGVSELPLTSVTNDVQSTFGSGSVQFTGNSIDMVADASSAPSASRFIQTDDMDMSRYSSVYVAYERTFSRQSSSGNEETGYVSMHTGDITEQNFSYGERGTLRGSETDIEMTSDVVTDEGFNRRYNVMKLDVSGLSGTENVTVHARAHSSNGGVTSVKIHEIWAGSRDSTGSVSQLFDSNIYPDTTADGIQYISTRNGVGMTGIGDSAASITSKTFSSQQLSVNYDIFSQANNNYEIETNGFDISSGSNNGTVSTSSAGDTLSLTSNGLTQPLLVNYLESSVESSNADNPIVKLDASRSSALPDDEYRWSAENPQVVDIKSPDSQTTIAEFTQTGEHNITLRIDSQFGTATTTETVQVDSIKPDINLQIPETPQLGSSIPVAVESDGDTQISEIVLMFGNGEKRVLNEPTTIDYTYTNPGSYEVTAVAKTQNGLTSADSADITVDTLGVNVADRIFETVSLPNDVYFDTTGDQVSVPEDIQPAEIIRLDTVIGNEDEMSYTWNLPDGSTAQGPTYIYETDTEGTDIIQLDVQGPSGRVETLTIELEKTLAVPEIQSITTSKDSVKSFESFDVEYVITHNSDISSQFDISLNDGTSNISAQILGGTSGNFTTELDTTDLSPGDLPRNYDIELYVEDEYSRSDRETTTIEVERGPRADFGFLDNGPYTVGRSVPMDASASEEPYNQELTYTWRFEGTDSRTGTEIVKQGDPTVSYPFKYIDDQATVELTVTDANGDEDTIQKNVAVNPNPAAALSASSVQRTGSEHEFAFDAGSSSTGGINNNIETYRFDFDSDGNYETTQSSPVANYAYENAGDYRAEVEVVDRFGYSDTATVTVTAQPGILTDPVRLTTCGNPQARLGPSQSDCNTEYSGTQLDGNVNVYDNGIQELDLTGTGYYRIKAVGAGYSGGQGAEIEGVVNVNSDTTLQIAVGQQGYDGGGAGGSFVARGSSYSSADPVIVAGGGALGSNDGNTGGNKDANTGTSGNDGYGTYPNTVSGGTSGSGGSGADGTGGGGFYGNGGGGQSTGQGGYAFRNGAMGAGEDVQSSYGGFGGGGVAEDHGDEPGGGGGYSGGGGADDDPPEYGGGGGSYVSNNFIYDTRSVGNNGAGYVEIEYLGSTLPNIESCQDLQDEGIQQSGQYVIFPDGQPISVYCDMSKDGGGWTGIDATTARELASNIGGGLTTSGSIRTQGFDSDDQPYYTNNGDGGAQYDIQTGFNFDEMYMSGVEFRPNTRGSDTSDYQYHSNYEMNTWEYYDPRSNCDGDIGFGSAAAGGPVRTYADAGNSFESSNAITAFPYNGNVYNVRQDDTVRMMFTETCGQDEGWKWEDGRIFVR